MKLEPSLSSPEIPPATPNPPVASAVDPVLLDHPLFQQLVEEYRLAKECLDAQKFVLDRLSAIFREFGVASTATNPEECEQSLRAWLGDARALYRVFTGELKASEFLSASEKLMAPEVFGSVVLDLSAFLAPRLQKLVEELTDPGKRQGNASIIAVMLATGLQGWEAHRPIFERRMLTVQQLQRKVHELCMQAGISERQEMQSIENEISRAIGGDILALTQVESGDFSEVERLFAERLQKTGNSIQ